MAKSEEEAAARDFAAALDGEDYASAEALIAPGCLYHAREETIQGAKAIVASYRDNGDSARDRFEDIRYKSRVRGDGPGRARIDFTDIVTVNGNTHTFKCRQVLVFDDTGLIREILHEDFPGERDRLANFMEENGL